MEHGQEDPDPWQGLRFVVTELIVRNAGNHTFVDAIITTPKGTGAVTEHRQQLITMLQNLTQQAKSHGRLRADFTTDDVILALVAARGLSAMDASRREIAARRLAALILDALQQEP